MQGLQCTITWRDSPLLQFSVVFYALLSMCFSNSFTTLCNSKYRQT